MKNYEQTREREMDLLCLVNSQVNRNCVCKKLFAKNMQKNTKEWDLSSWGAPFFQSRENLVQAANYFTIITSAKNMFMIYKLYYNLYDLITLMCVHKQTLWQCQPSELREVHQEDLWQRFVYILQPLIYQVFSLAIHCIGVLI